MDYHKVKTLPEYFQEVWTGTKKFEVRQNDRGYRTGDVIQLLEFDLKKGYSGRSVEAIIGYVLTAEQFPGLAPGYAAFSLVAPTHSGAPA